MKIQLENKKDIFEMLKSYIENYKALENIARELKTNPKTLITYLANFGDEVLNNATSETSEVLKKSFETFLNSGKAFKTLEISINTLQSITKFLEGLKK
jgi:predicted transcriptional regulator